MLIEDTFILLDALEQDAEELRDAKPLVCLEIGYATCYGLTRTRADKPSSSGSGCVSAFTGSILGSFSSRTSRYKHHDLVTVLIANTPSVSHDGYQSLCMSKHEGDWRAESSSSSS